MSIITTCSPSRLAFSRTLTLPLTTALLLAGGCIQVEDTSQDTDGQDTDIGTTGTGGTETDGPMGPCELIEQSDVDVDLDLEAGCYEVETLLSVQGTTLSMQPGVEITFASGSGLAIGQNGVLQAIGTAEEPILMQGQTAMPGEWSGLAFVGSPSSNNRLEYVTVMHAGGSSFGNAGAITLSGGSRLQVSASVLADNAGVAVSAADTSQVSLDSTTVEGNEAALRLAAGTVEGVAADNTFDANDSNVAVVTGGSVQADATWHAIGIPFHPESHLQIEAALTLEPGVSIAMAQEARINVRVEGQLNAMGTEAAPVTFTGQQAEVGYWAGLSVASKSSNNVLDGCLVEYGGGDNWTGNGDSAGMVYLEADSKLTVRNSVLRNSVHYAVRAERGADLGGFEGNHIENNARTVIVEPDQGRSIAPDNVFENNAEQKVRVVFGNTDRIETAQTWSALAVPWLVMDRFYVEAPWTIEAGTTIEFAQDASAIVRNGGTITAVGTADATIVFTGAEGLAGFWKGLEVATLSADNQLEHAVVEYAGADGWTGGTDREAAFYVSAGGVLSLSETVIRESAGNGILLATDGSVTCSSVTFEGIAKDLVAGTGVATGCI